MQSVPRFAKNAMLLFGKARDIFRPPSRRHGIRARPRFSDPPGKISFPSAPFCVVGSTLLSCPHHRKSPARRTFAIISHPDAGKTTLTEKCSFTAMRCTWPARSRTARISGPRGPTGWNWSDSAASRFSSTVLQFEYAGYAVQPARHARPQGFFGGHLPGAQPRWTQRDGDRRRQGQSRRRPASSSRSAAIAACPSFTFINKCDRPTLKPARAVDELENVLGPPGVRGDRGRWVRTHPSQRGLRIGCTRGASISLNAGPGALIVPPTQGRTSATQVVGGELDLNPPMPRSPSNSHAGRCRPIPLTPPRCARPADRPASLGSARPQFGRRAAARRSF